MPDNNGVKLTVQEALKNEDVVGRKHCDTSLADN
jgi:hypothetical protein